MHGARVRQHSRDMSGRLPRCPFRWSLWSAGEDEAGASCSPANPKRVLPLQWAMRSAPLRAITHDAAMPGMPGTAAGRGVHHPVAGPSPGLVPQAEAGLASGAIGRRCCPRPRRSCRRSQPNSTIRWRDCMACWPTGSRHGRRRMQPGYSSVWPAKTGRWQSAWPRSPNQGLRPLPKLSGSWSTPSGAAGNGSVGSTEAGRTWPAAAIPGALGT